MSIQTWKFKTAWSWPKHIGEYFKEKVENPSLHVFSGMSPLGTVRIDLFMPATIKADVRFLPIRDNLFQTVFGDPAWHTAKHLRSKIMYELRRVTRIGGKIIINANWNPNNLKGCKLEQPILYSRPRMPFGNTALIFTYTKYEDWPPQNKQLVEG